MKKCRFLPMSFTTRNPWDDEGDAFFEGCRFEQPFGDIPAGEYRSVLFGAETQSVIACTPDGRVYEADFTLVPKEMFNDTVVG